MEMQTEIDAPFYNPVALAKQFITEAVANLQTARQQEHEEWLADQQEWQRMQKSEANKRGWEKRRQNSRRWSSGAPPDDSPIAVTVETAALADVPVGELREAF